MLRELLIVGVLIVATLALDNAQSEEKADFSKVQPMAACDNGEPQNKEVPQGLKDLVESPQHTGAALVKELSYSLQRHEAQISSFLANNVRSTDTIAHLREVCAWYRTQLERLVDATIANLDAE